VYNLQDTSVKQLDIVLERQ
jgi:hypothetical protein